MRMEDYPVVSGQLIVKYGAYNTARYFIQDLTTKKAGFANKDLKELLLLCDGTKNISEIIDKLSLKYNEPKSNLVAQNIRRNQDLVHQFHQVSVIHQHPVASIVCREFSGHQLDIWVRVFYIPDI